MESRMPYVLECVISTQIRLPDTFETLRGTNQVTPQTPRSAETRVTPWA
jgi:hypothetical protein